MAFIAEIGRPIAGRYLTISFLAVAPKKPNYEMRRYRFMIATLPIGHKVLNDRWGGGFWKLREVKTGEI